MFVMSFANVPESSGGALADVTQPPNFLTLVLGVDARSVVRPAHNVPE